MGPKVVMKNPTYDFRYAFRNMTHSGGGRMIRLGNINQVSKYTATKSSFTECHHSRVYSFLTSDPTTRVCKHSVLDRVCLMQV